MARLIILLAAVTAGYLIYKLYFKQMLAQGKSGKIKIALVVLGLVFLVMAATGRAHVLFGLIGAALTQVMRIAPLLVRYAPFLQKFLGAGTLGSFGAGAANSANARQSRVRTDYLVMTLDHANGSIGGEIIAGAFKGRQLSDLDNKELQQLYLDCKENDVESIRVLQAYIARERPDWKGEAAGENQATNKGSSSITVREAYDILALEQGASRDEVIRAHRTLITRFHPDKGGSNYLTAKINEAKKILLAHIPEE